MLFIYHVAYIGIIGFHGEIKSDISIYRNCFRRCGSYIWHDSMVDLQSVASVVMFIFGVKKFTGGKYIQDTEAPALPQHCRDQNYVGPNL